MKIFVYGTLKRGEKLHSLIATQRLVGQAVICPFRLFSNGAIPYLIPAKAGYEVHGEVFEVTPAMRDRLDQLEGHPTWYRRVKVRARLKDQTTVMVETYALTRRYRSTLCQCRELTTGRFHGSA